MQTVIPTDIIAKIYTNNPYTKYAKSLLAENSCKPYKMPI
jgi:hypothetical protein